MFKHSHNDYWAPNKITDAINADCNIVEVDVIYKRGEILLSHSWRPWAWLCYGRLKDYLRILDFKVFDHDIYLYIEIKTGDVKAIYKICALMMSYPRIKYVIGAFDKGGRNKIKYEIVKRMDKFVDVQGWEEFKLYKDIERVDLFTKKPWYKRLNHF